MFSQPSIYELFGIIIAALLLWAFLDWIGVVGPKRIKGLPCVPGLPFVGNLYQVNNNPALQYLQWSQRYGDVFQMRLGSRMVVVANSYQSVKELWVLNSSASNSRPVLYTFHKVVSKTQGFTVGTTPWGADYKNMKKIIATSLNKKNVDAFSDFISFECRQMFRRINAEMLLCKRLGHGEDIDVFKLLQGFVLRVSLYITYGYLVKVEHTDTCKLFEEITHVENKIVRLRGHSSNKQDYLPVLRYLGVSKKTEQANDYRKRRDVYMAKFHNDLLSKIKKNADFKDCIVSRVLAESSEFPKDVTEAQLNSVCLTMVSAGLDNTPLVLNHILGHLSQPNGYGHDIQEEAFAAMLKRYGSVETAFRQCGVEFEVDYIMAILKEGLRFFSVLPTSLPRATTKDIYYKNCVIPSGSILFMNAFGANHDDHHFENPYVFEPRRFLDAKGKLDESISRPDHLTFGVGTRMCGGSHLAMKEMYIALARFILLYHIEAPKEKQYLMGLDSFEMNAEPDSVAFEPRVFKLKLRVRDEEAFYKMVLMPDLLEN